MQKDRPEDVARVVAMMMLCDGDLQDDELDRLEEIGAFTVMGLDRNGFADVVQGYFDELVAGADAEGRVNPLVPERVNALADAVEDAATRLATARLMLAIGKADDDLSPNEMAVFRHVLGRWGLDLDDLTRDCC